MERSVVELQRPPMAELANTARQVERFAREFQREQNSRFQVDDPDPDALLRRAAAQLMATICDMDILEFLQLQALMEFADFTGEAQESGYEIPEWAFVFENNTPSPPS